ncbi:phosphonate C-P lyase system protein PhnG [Zavarzinia compransoris]|uniref:Phosphonate C-P lyase system protein PhnG n=1 Tax=Zavarzinia compransoris TaxID=1264899 RepID=A0A317E9B4_9PROT|nr:phosphonate C-P lyase system protein PhnG [Zavarzinia compransoris]PWR23321.1 phosphonate C-P lyase system protein PhnG [Zavarzinia compransoris]TDP46107.1 alpha-D-ribose 1-methylphosphonate 5-triphosphate synthase subunit PhnG [Zavarzinia compransoris]
MSDDRQQEGRRRWLAVLARAPRARLAAALDDVPAGHGLRVLRPAETGLVMVRGRAGGTGERFNMGEMTVSRCTVADGEGRLGVGVVAGRDRAKAELVARLDALMQDPALGPALDRDLIAPLAAEQAAAAAARAGRAAATKVDFFTMVRGDV